MRSLFGGAKAATAVLRRLEWSVWLTIRWHGKPLLDLEAGAGVGGEE
ncbi:MAG: hypothetical protein AMXMBFR64_04980 [Myxococcales bacterium]